MADTPLPSAWDAYRRLLAHAGRPAWLVDDDGVVAWCNDQARRQVPAMATPGTRMVLHAGAFVGGQTVATDAGSLTFEAIEGGWAVFLEPVASYFDAASILDLLPMPIFWKDQDGIYRGCNHAFARLVEKTPEDIVGKGVFQVYPPGLADTAHAMDLELRRAGEDAVQSYEWENGALEGAPFRVLFHKANVIGEGGHVVGQVGTVTDITPQRRAERKLATVFAACPDPITVTERATGRYLDVNPAFYTATGLTREQALGHTSLELGIWVSEDDRNAMLAALAAEGRLTNFETRFRRRDGSVFTALLSAEPTKLDNMDCLVLVSRDISARKNEENLLRRTADELYRSNVELERFAYVAAHDLQEPCRTICSFAQLLERRCGALLGDEEREYLTYLSDGAQRMRQLIQGLLGYSRVDGNGMRFETVDLGGLVTSALGDLASAITQAQAEVRVGPLPNVRGDAVQLRQVLVNLIGNALKFQPPGQRPQVEVSARRDPAGWCVSVRDNGIGIAPEYRDEVFGMFRRLHGAAAYPGTGIGLALVKRIVEAHGGRIWMDSTPGQGSTFCFTLPE